MSYNKVQFSNDIFDLPRQDFFSDFTELFIISKDKGIEELEELLNEDSSFTILDNLNNIIKEYTQYINLISIKDVNLDGEDTYAIKLQEEELAPMVEQNTANIDYIAAMTDIELQ